MCPFPPGPSRPCIARVKCPDLLARRGPQRSSRAKLGLPGPASRCPTGAERAVVEPGDAPAGPPVKGDVVEATPRGIVKSIPLPTASR